MKKVLSLIAFLVLSFNCVYAQPYDLHTQSAGNWNVNIRWDEPTGCGTLGCCPCGVNTFIPTSNDDASINNNITIPTGYDATCSTLDITGNFTLTIETGASLTVTNNVINSGVIIVEDGATLTIGGTYTSEAATDLLTMIGSTSIVNITGSVINDGVFTITGDFDCGAMSNYYQVFVQDEGNATISGTYTSYVAADLLTMSGANPSVNITGTVENDGTITAVKSFTSGGFTDNNIFNLTSGTATVNGNFLSSTDININGGTLDINGNLVNDATVDIASGATLDVSGNFTQIGGDILTMAGATPIVIIGGTVSNAGLITARNSFTSGSFTDNLDFVINSGTATINGDFINSIATVDIANGSTLNVIGNFTSNNTISCIVTMTSNDTINITGVFTNDGETYVNGLLTAGGILDNHLLNIQSGKAEISGNFQNNGELLINDGDTLIISGNYTALTNTDLLDMIGPLGHVAITGTVSNVGDIHTNGTFTSGAFLTNDYLNIESGSTTVSGNFVNIFDVVIRNGANLNITGNFSQSAGDQLTMASSVTSTVTIGGSATSAGTITVYNSFTAGSITNTGTFNLEGSPTLTLTSGNFENNGTLYLNNTTSNGDIIINTGTDTLKNNINATALTGTYVDYESLAINGNLFLQTNMTVNADQTLTVTGNVEIHDDATDSENNTLTLNGVSNFGSTLLTNTNLDINGFPSGNDRTKLVINNNLTVTGGVTFNNSSYFRANNDYGISRAVVELNVGTIDLDSDITFITGEISSDMSADNGGYYDADVDNVFNALSIATTSPMTVDGQITFGTDTTANPNFITTNGGNFILINNNDVKITFTHGEPFINYQGGMRTDDTYIFGTNESGGDLIFATDSTHLVLPTHPNNSFPDMLVEGTCDTVVTAYKTQADQIKGTLYIGHDGVDRVIKLVDGANFDGFESSTYGAMRIGIDSNGVVTDANCIYFMKDSACSNGIPEFAGTDVTGGGTKFQFNDSTIFEFNVSAGKSFQILTETTRGQYTVYPRVYLTGAGEKVCNIDNGAFLIFADNGLDYIELTEGDLTFAAGSDFVLTNKLGFGGILQTYNAATINIRGDFGQGPTANVFFGDGADRYTTVNYNSSTGNQQIYQFYQDGLTGTSSPEDYDILKISTTGTDEATLNIPINVGTRLEIADDGHLTLNNGGKITLKSNATYTAYVAEINDPNSINIDYVGNGEFVVEKYMSLTNFTTYDFTSPIVNQALTKLPDNGIQTRGFPNSSVPGARFASVTFYDETQNGNTNIGFEKALDANNTFFDATTGITRSAYRVNLGSGTFTYEDNGQIRYGTHTYDLSYTDTGSPADDGWNLVGNPYPAPIDLEKLYLANQGAFDGGNINTTAYLYRFHDTGANKQNYSTFNVKTGVETHTTLNDTIENIIPTNTAFWLQSDGTNLTINEGVKADIENTYHFKNKKNTSPELATIAVQYNGVQTDKTYFHYWPKSSVGKDKLFDSPRFTSELKPNSLNFTLGNQQSLNLLVNAFSKDLNYVELPLLVNFANNGEYTITLDNLASFLSNYDCAYIKNIHTGELYPLSDNTHSFTFNTSELPNGEKLALVFKNELEKYIDIKQPLCFGEEGKFSIDFKTSKKHQYVLTGDNGYNSTFFVDKSKIDITNLEEGNYILKSINGSISCTGDNFEFTISNAPKLIDNISFDTQQVKTNTPITFNATGNADSYVWQIENNDYYGKTIIHTFVNDGLQKVVVYAAANNDACVEQHEEDVFVNKNFTAVNDNLEIEKYISTNSNQITLNNKEEIARAAIYSVDGKLISSFENTYSNTKQPRVVILRLALTNGKTVSKRLYLSSK